MIYHNLAYLLCHYFYVYLNDNSCIKLKYNLL